MRSQKVPKKALRVVAPSCAEMAAGDPNGTVSGIAQLRCTQKGWFQMETVLAALKF